MNDKRGWLEENMEDPKFRWWLRWVTVREWFLTRLENFRGRPLKIRARDGEINKRDIELYDQDAGEGAFERAVAETHDSRMGLLVSNIFDEPMKVGEHILPPRTTVEMKLEAGQILRVVDRVGTTDDGEESR